MLLLAAWTTNGWMPSGHALRMALDLGLHRALGKLAEDNKRRSEEEERHLGMPCLVSVIKSSGFATVVSARVWLCLYWFDHQWVQVLIDRRSTLTMHIRMSLGTGRPIVLRDESSIKHCRLLLTHPMASPTDVRLISQVELITQKGKLAPFKQDANALYPQPKSTRRLPL